MTLPIKKIDHQAFTNEDIKKMIKALIGSSNVKIIFYLLRLKGPEELFSTKNHRKLLKTMFGKHRYQTIDLFLESYPSLEYKQLVFEEACGCSDPNYIKTLIEAGVDYKPFVSSIIELVKINNLGPDFLQGLTIEKILKERTNSMNSLD